MLGLGGLDSRLRYTSLFVHQTGLHGHLIQLSALSRPDGSERRHAVPLHSLACNSVGCDAQRCLLLFCATICARDTAVSVSARLIGNGVG